ncbi:MAG: glycosyltransferase family 2 protein [Acidimicrobiia bacterium]|nr:glycosyltransferase family 2 protein [Acidimicrobiia bacterium]
MQPRLSVVIPIHNEAAFLPTALPGLLEEMSRVGQEWELLLIENGSTDGTAERARELLAGADVTWTVVEMDSPDYGDALSHGMAIASGESIVMFDIDYYSGAFVTAALDAGADVVIASKRAPGSDDRRTTFRRLGTWGFNLLLRTLLDSGVGDTHGMKVFRRSAIAQLLPDVVARKDLFDTELVIRAERNGASIVELPVVVEEQRDARSSYVSRVPRTVRGLLDMRRRLG